MIDIKKAYAAIEAGDDKQATDELDNCINTAIDLLDKLISSECIAALPILVAMMEVVGDGLKNDFSKINNGVYLYAKSRVDSVEFKECSKSEK